MANSSHSVGSRSATHSTGSHGIAHHLSPHSHLPQTHQQTQGTHPSTTAVHSSHSSVAQHDSLGYPHHLPAHPHSTAAHPTRNAPHLHHVAHSQRHHSVHQALHGAGHANFIKSASISAKQSELLTGVPASITVAQAILESGWGEKHIGLANNYFGVKAHVVDGKLADGGLATGYVVTKTGEHIGGKNIKVSANFRSYKSMADSFTDHGQFLRDNPRYHSILDAYQKTGDVTEFSKGLQKAGYATDPGYADNLIFNITKYKLHSIDVVQGKVKQALKKP